MKQHNPEILDINIQISIEALQKVILWRDIAKGEVSMLGLVEEILYEDTGSVETLLVTDVFLLKQVCNDCETELDPEAVAQLMMELEAEGVDTGKLRCWIHSHGTMQVFWSKTDDQTIEGLSNGEWLLSLVVNKAHSTMMRLDQFHPAHMYFENVAWSIHYPAIDGLKEQCQKEFKEKVNEQPSFLSLTGSKKQKQMPKHELGILPDEMEDESWWEGIDDPDNPYEVMDYGR